MNRYLKIGVVVILMMAQYSSYAAMKVAPKPVARTVFADPGLRDDVRLQELSEIGNLLQERGAATQEIVKYIFDNKITLDKVRFFLNQHSELQGQMLISAFAQLIKTSQQQIEQKSAGTPAGLIVGFQKLIGTLDDFKIAFQKIIAQDAAVLAKKKAEEAAAKKTQLDKRFLSQQSKDKKATGFTVKDASQRREAVQAGKVKVLLEHNAKVSTIQKAKKEQQKNQELVAQQVRERAQKEADDKKRLLEEAKKRGPLSLADEMEEVDEELPLPTMPRDMSAVVSDDEYEDSPFNEGAIESLSTVSFAGPEIPEDELASTISSEADEPPKAVVPARASLVVQTLTPEQEKYFQKLKIDIYSSRKIEKDLDGAKQKGLTSQALVSRLVSAEIPMVDPKGIATHYTKTMLNFTVQADILSWGLRNGAEDAVCDALGKFAKVIGSTELGWNKAKIGILGKNEKELSVADLCYLYAFEEEIVPNVWDKYDDANVQVDGKIVTVEDQATIPLGMIQDVEFWLASRLNVDVFKKFTDGMVEAFSKGDLDELCDGLVKEPPVAAIFKGTLSGLHAFVWGTYWNRKSMPDSSYLDSIPPKDFRIAQVNPDLNVMGAARIKEKEIQNYFKNKIYVYRILRTGFRNEYDLGGFSAKVLQAYQSLGGKLQGFLADKQFKLPGTKPAAKVTPAVVVPPAKEIKKTTVPSAVVSPATTPKQVVSVNPPAAKKDQVAVRAPELLGPAPQLSRVTSIVAPQMQQDLLAAFFEAVQSGKEKEVEASIKLNAAWVNKTAGNKTYTPLHYAAQADKPAVIKKLLEKGASLAAQAKDGNTPLGVYLLSSNAKDTTDDKSTFMALCSARDFAKALALKNNNGSWSIDIAWEKGLKNIARHLYERSDKTVGKSETRDAIGLLIKQKKLADNEKKAADNTVDLEKERQQLFIDVAHKPDADGFKEACTRVEKALKKGLELQKDKDGNSVLMIAVDKGSTKMVEFILLNMSKEGIKELINEKNKGGDTPLICAAKKRIGDNTKLMEILLNNGADIMAQDGAGNTALIWEIKNIDSSSNLKNHDELKSIDLLCKAGSRFDTKGGRSFIELKNNNGETALFFAAGRGDTSIIQALEGYNADDNAVNVSDETPLFYAAREGKVDAAKLLIEKGADVNATNKKGETPLAYAQRAKKADVIKMLIEKGATQTLEPLSSEGTREVSLDDDSAEE